MHPALLVATGGALGALGRWAIGSFSAGTAFPWATLGVNLIGSLLLGVLAAAFSSGAISRDAVLSWALDSWGHLRQCRHTRSRQLRWANLVPLVL